MGARRRKRSRRGRSPGTAGPAPAARRSEGGGRRPRQGAEPEERPAAPWGSFPLSELAILTGAALMVAGFVVGQGSRQAVLLLAGVGIASLGAIEVSVREHLTGYRSHTLLLSAVPAVAVLGLLFFAAPAGLGPLARLAIGAAVYGLAAWGLTALFRARSGQAFRIKARRR